MQDSNEELVAYNRKFKKAILDVMFSLSDTFYVHCVPNPLLHIGSRGLQDREEREGIVLVFGPYSTKNLNWDETGIHCEMQFNKWERVRIPFECIDRMFDKSGQVNMQWATLVSAESHREEQIVQKTESGATQEPARRKEKSRVIEVDFTRKKK
ncbi:MAG: stringent starvation protein B [Leptospirales bacterium]|nr:stringent starvation protein B [Leptospirales bacterium]